MSELTGRDTYGVPAGDSHCACQTRWRPAAQASTRFALIRLHPLLRYIYAAHPSSSEARREDEAPFFRGYAPWSCLVRTGCVRLSPRLLRKNNNCWLPRNHRFIFHPLSLPPSSTGRPTRCRTNRIARGTRVSLTPQPNSVCNNGESKMASSQV